MFTLDLAASCFLSGAKSHFWNWNNIMKEEKNLSFFTDLENKIGFFRLFKKIWYGLHLGKKKIWFGSLLPALENPTEKESLDLPRCFPKGEVSYGVFMSLTAWRIVALKRDLCLVTSHVQHLTKRPSCLQSLVKPRIRQRQRFIEWSTGPVMVIF